MNRYEKYALEILKRAHKEIDYDTVWKYIDDETDGYFMTYDVLSTTDIIEDAEAVLGDWFDSKRDGLRY